MSELFTIPISESPRKRWLRSNGVQTHCSGPAEHYDGEPWAAWVGELGEAIETKRMGCGATEDDAVCALARGLGLRLWNEEAYGKGWQ